MSLKVGMMAALSNVRVKCKAGKRKAMRGRGGGDASVKVLSFESMDDAALALKMPSGHVRGYILSI